MPTASATWNPIPPLLDWSAVTHAVARFDRTQATGQRYTFLPNVFCERVVYREGAQPPQAQFSYILDSSDPTDPFPSYAEQLWPLSATTSTPNVVKLGDELVVLATDPLGNTLIIFDGFADAPQIDMAKNGQSVTFTASGVAVRCWDQPIEGAIYRQADDPNAGDEVPTELPARFNPDTKPNCTPDGFDVNEGQDDAYPVFLDWRIMRTPDPRAFWTLGGFTRYLLQSRPSGDLTYVDNPKSKFLSGLDGDLEALLPTAGNNASIDVTNPSTYTKKPIIVDDVLATGKPWPVVLAQTLDRYGFAMRFRIGQDTTTPLPEPKNDLYLDRKDGLYERPPRDLMLQAVGSFLDPTQSNVESLRLVRDARDACNQVRVYTRPNRFEVGIILAPGFTIAAADATTPDQFKTPAIATAAGNIRKKYRVFVADEAGDGHANLNVSPPTWVTDSPLDLSAVFGKPDPPDPEDPDAEPPPPNYVNRCRPAIEQLVALDDAGRPFKAELAISTNFLGPCPGVWDGTSGTWQSLGHVGWRLLKDRLGIEITVDDPNAWKIPDTPGATAPVVAGGIVRIVESLAAPTTARPLFYLKLTCVIEGDWGLDILAEKRSVAPGGFAVERDVDCRDIYRHDVVHKSSIHYVAPSGSSLVGPFDVDDTGKAVGTALAQRSAREFPAVAGSVTIPWITFAYHVGDLVRQVAGRNLDLRINAGAGVGQSPAYPSIVSVSYNLSGRQSTTLELSDRRGEGGPS